MALAFGRAPLPHFFSLLSFLIKYDEPLACTRKLFTAFAAQLTAPVLDLTFSFRAAGLHERLFTQTVLFQSVFLLPKAFPRIN